MKLKLGYIKLLIIELVLFISLFFSKLIYSSNLNSIVFLFIIFFLLIYLIGYEKDKHLYKKDTIQVIIIFSIVYYLVTYLLGLFSGFLKNSYSLSIASILQNVVPYIIIITLLELIRYIIVSKSIEKKFIIVIITLILTGIDVIMMHGSYGLNTYKSSFMLTSLYILPSLSKNFLLSYIIYRFGYKPSIVYRFLMEVPLFVLPFFPNFGNYIGSIIKIVFPVLLYYRITKFSVKKEGDVYSKKIGKIINVGLLVFTIFIVYFTCGLFRYYAIAVGSGSMTPNVNLGDVVVVEKIPRDKLYTLKKGEILVYKHDNKTIVHRIVAINKVNDKYIFRTKGDHNEANDNYDIDSDDVIGKVNVKISYIGYPVVWINELFKSKR